MQRAIGVTTDSAVEEADGADEVPVRCAEPYVPSQRAASPASAPALRVITPPANIEKLFALQTKDMSKVRMQALEQFRVLRSRLLETMRLAGMRTLLVTSSVAHEGKTVTSINLAFALSRVEGLRILLVDADLRKPSIAHTLDIPIERGLLQYLRSGATLSEITLHLSGNLDFIPCMGSAESSAELLHSAEMRELLRKAREMYDITILDAPPLFPIADARVLSSAVDGVVFCIRAKSTPESIVKDAVALVNKKVVGTVLVGTQKSSHGYYYYRGARQGD
jgi:capsular exopolysaccharide synthesis family protein